MKKKITYFLIMLILSIISIVLGFHAIVIPNFILYALIFIYLILLTIILLTLKKKKIFIKIIRFILTIIIIICSLGITIVYIKTNSFFNNIKQTEFQTVNYNVIVLKDSNYNKIDDIAEIGTYNILDKNYNEALNLLTKKKTLNKKEYSKIPDLVNDLINKKIEAIFINENYIDMIIENNEIFENAIKIIDTITINNKIEETKKDVDILNEESFNIYISGIDTYGEISNVSRSDVNIIATVNIKENKILLTSIPRDMYVQLHGTTGTKDKLTHAGVYGIDMSINTIEDFLNTDINYYVRINFNSLIQIVDSIKGIDIYSDTSFVPHTNKNVYINEGLNHLNGAEALAYSRERYTYIDGDRHRGRNQQQVIEAIINKVTSSNDINTYVDLINTLEKSFQTNIDKTMINKLINMQVKNNYKWNINSIQITGYDAADYTYSYPGQLLYVMQVDEKSLNMAKEQINNYLNKEETNN